MKVCHILSGDTWGGAEAQALALMRALAKRIDVCAIVFNDGVLRKRLEDSGIATRLADERAHGLAGLLWTVSSQLQLIRPSVVHVHGIKEHAVAGLAARLHRIPVARTYHGRGMLQGAWRYATVERFSASFLTDTAIAVSAELASYLHACRVWPGDLRVIVNGLPPGALDTEERLSRRSEKAESKALHIGTVGRLTPVKSHATLLEAFSQVCDRIPNAELTIVGEGPLMDELVRQASRLNVLDRVTFAGFRDDVLDIVRTFDVFVLSSKHEGIPIAVLEAMSVGVPVICTHVGGLPEVIEDGRNGILVPPGDPGAIAAAICSLDRERELGRRLSIYGRKTVLDRFTHGAMVDGTLLAYAAASRGKQ